jgi:hypothetical protein
MIELNHDLPHDLDLVSELLVLLMQLSILLLESFVQMALLEESYLHLLSIQLVVLTI